MSTTLGTTTTHNSGDDYAPKHRDTTVAGRIQALSRDAFAKVTNTSTAQYVGKHRTSTGTAERAA